MKQCDIFFRLILVSSELEAIALVFQLWFLFIFHSRQLEDVVSFHCPGHMLVLVAKWQLDQRGTGEKSECCILPNKPVFGCCLLISFAILVWL